ncbi:MAG: hypothetical protein L3J97_03540 [Thermoplasmata archaeon]|nr:hypothetical protein [Thermoplasmata archaeon]
MSADKPLAEPAVIAQVRELLATAEPARAVLIGFETVMRDFEAAFGSESPPEWTYADVFRLGVRPDMGYLPVLLARLYRIYEPVRYGGTDSVAAGDVLETLRLIYNQPPLRLTTGLEPGLPMGARERGIPIRFPLVGATPSRGSP